MDRIDTGYALYGSLTLIELPVTLLVEGKHYRRFFPLSANVKLANAREFNLVQYNAPPTAEAFWVDTLFENFNTCATGGRAKADFQVGKDEGVFRLARSHLQLGRIGRQRRMRNRGRESEPSLGPRQRFRHHLASAQEPREHHGRRAHRRNRLGARRRGRPLRAGAVDCTNVFYEEGYARYDVIRWLGGPFAIQFQGWHRPAAADDRRPRRTLVRGLSHTTGLSWSPHVSLAFRRRVRHAAGDAGQLLQRTARLQVHARHRSLSVRRPAPGALRCVGGVCRVFPPFEGARLDFTARF
jgi:hypothetical protein